MKALLFLKNKAKLSWQTKVSIIVAAFLCSLLLISVGSSVRAQDEASATTATEWYYEESADGLLPGMIDSVVSMIGMAPARDSQDSLSGFLYSPAQTEGEEALEALGMDTRNYVNGGALGALNYVDTIAYENPPVSTPEYTRFMAERVGIAQQASAEVEFYDALSPLIIIWQQVRNITYVVMILIMLAVGLMVMFGARSGQETVSFASSLVGFAVALVLITFSYPLGSLIADLCVNVGNNLVADIFDPYVNASEILNSMYDPASGVNAWTLGRDVQVFGVSQSAVNLMGQILLGLGYPLGKVTDFMSSFGSGSGYSAIGWVLGHIAGFVQGITLFGIRGAAQGNDTIIVAIMAFVVFITSIRITLALVMAYFSLAMWIVFSPVAFLSAAFPGGLGGIGNWFKAVAAEALVFPVIFGCFMLCGVFFNIRKAANPDCTYTDRVGNEIQVIGHNQDSRHINTVGYLEEDGSRCYPALLPPKFNLWPAPLGYIEGVEPDDLMRFMFGFGVYLAAPALAAGLKELLNVKQYKFVDMIGGGFKAGAGAFAGYVQRIPSFGIGKGIGSFVQQTTSSI